MIFKKEPEHDDDIYGGDDDEDDDDDADQVWKGQKKKYGPSLKGATTFWEIPTPFSHLCVPKPKEKNNLWNCVPNLHIPIIYKSII